MVRNVLFRVMTTLSYRPSLSSISQHDPDQIKKVTEDEFRIYFEQFGPVFEAVVMLDRITGRSRGFGFVTFQDKAVCSKLLSLDDDDNDDNDPHHDQHNNNSNNSNNKHCLLSMRDKTIEVKPAQPKTFASIPMQPVFYDYNNTFICNNNNSNSNMIHYCCPEYSYSPPQPPLQQQQQQRFYYFSPVPPPSPPVSPGYYSPQMISSSSSPPPPPLPLYEYDVYPLAPSPDMY
jgi:RNA recognition motif-containing protein